jgi:hypothetical protein
MTDDKNKRVHDPIEADDYLTHWETHLDGSSFQRNLKQGQEGKVEGQINQDGDYSFEQFNFDGSRSFLVQGDNKESADSHTESINNNKDELIGGGHYFRASDGIMNETGGNFEAHDGPNISASSEGHQLFSEGGDGLHVMHGNQSFVTESGRVDNYASDGYSVGSDATVEINSLEDVSITSDSSTGIISNKDMSVDASKIVKIKAGTAANVICGICELGMTPTQAKLNVGPMASITMNPGSIKITCGVSTIILTPAGIEIATPSLDITTAATNMDTGAATINSGGVITMAAGAEAVLTGGGGALIGSGAELALVAQLVLIG